eukprot:SAG31_NODE_44910_length_260_cov_50.105590_1_plen_44_part_10
MRAVHFDKFLQDLGPLSYGVYSQDLLLLNLVNLNLVLNLYAVFV